MSNNKLHILIGISGSGKSTFAEQMLLSDDRLIRVSRDEYRYMWRNSGLVSDKIESVITLRVNQDIEYYLNNDFNVIYDATNLTARYLNSMVADFQQYADIEFVLLEVDVEECIRRDNLRSRKVGESVIRSQYKKLEILKKNFDFQPLPKRKKKYRNFNTDAKKKDAVCVDLDGTLADLGERNPYGFGVLNDRVVFPVKNVLKSFVEVNPNITVLVVSGREEKMRKDTEQWLKTNKIPYNFLLLRKTGDNRRDAVIKKEIYTQEILPDYNVHFVLDDRNQVVDMLRNELGLTVFQVANGNF